MNERLQSSPRNLPTASLILLAYNQERYIADAIEGAFAQEYPNLDIVISDDSSSDRTFDIASKMAADYSGPHRLILNRTQANRGILAHLYEAVGLSRGDYVVLAAGDDVSLPRRVSRLIDCFVRTCADAAFSNWNVIDDHGRLVREGRPAEDKVVDLNAYFPGRTIRHITGVTSAYSREVFDAISVPAERMISEDLFFTFMLSLRSRRIEMIDEPLVEYRQHSEAITHRPLENGSLENAEAYGQAYAAKLVGLLEYFHRAAAEGAGVCAGFGTRAPVDLERLRSDILFHAFRSRWLEGSFARRLQALRLARSLPQLRWLLPRLFGLRGLLLARRIRDTLRRGDSDVTT